MSTGDQYPPSPEQQPQYPTNPEQQPPQYPPNPYQQQPQYPTNPYQQPPQTPYPGQPMPGQPYPTQPTYPSQPMYGAPPARPSGNGNRTLFIVLGSIAGLVVLGCCAVFGFAALANRAANSNLGSSQSTATTAATATTGSTTTSPNKHYKVGDVVAASDAFTVTVNSVTTSAGDDIFKPKTGNTFVVVDVTIKNTSSQEQEVSSLLQFGLKDATGQQYNETITSQGTPPDGKLEAGDQLKGQITYEVPQSQHDFTFSFVPDILSDGQTIWDLHI